MDQQQLNMSMCNQELQKVECVIHWIQNSTSAKVQIDNSLCYESMHTCSARTKLPADLFVTCSPLSAILDL
jgi:hypothetical protein